MSHHRKFLVSWLALWLVMNVLIKCLTLSADHPDHLILFRMFVSRKAAKKGRAVLEGVGLRTETIDTCFNSHPLDEQEAVQDGLVKWTSGQSHKSPTWQVLLEAMDYAEIADEHVQGLKKKLGLGMLCECMHACVLTF